MMKSVYPVLMSEKIEESRQFYKECFGFTEAFSNGWYTSLIHPDGGALALIDARHETIPAPYHGLVQGMLLNIEVENAARVYEEIGKKVAKMLVSPLRDEDYGQRHFMIEDPNGILIDVIEMIPPGK